MQIPLGTLVSFDKNCINPITQKEEIGLIIGVIGEDPLGNVMYSVMVNGIAINAWQDQILEKE
jgi:hypothetical protein